MNANNKKSAIKKTKLSGFLDNKTDKQTMVSTKESKLLVFMSSRIEQLNAKQLITIVLDR